MTKKEELRNIRAEKAKLLSEKMRALGVTNAKAASIIGCMRYCLSVWRTGKRVPSKNSLRLWSDAIAREESIVLQKIKQQAKVSERQDPFAEAKF